MLTDNGKDSWPPRQELDGLTYGDMRPYLPARTRLNWLRRSAEYQGQPFEELAAYYRRLGHDEQARLVLLARRCRDDRGRGQRPGDRQAVPGVPDVGEPVAPGAVRGRGRAALASKGAGGAQCKLAPGQLAELEAVLGDGPAACGYADQCWTLARIADQVWDRSGDLLGQAAASRGAERYSDTAVIC